MLCWSRNRTVSSISSSVGSAATVICKGLSTSYDALLLRRRSVGGSADAPARQPRIAGDPAPDKRQHPTFPSPTLYSSSRKNWKGTGFRALASSKRPPLPRRDRSHVKTLLPLQPDVHAIRAEIAVCVIDRVVVSVVIHRHRFGDRVTSDRVEFLVAELVEHR